MSDLQRSSEFDVQEFLTNYWQQKPLLIKQFYSHFHDPVSAEELAGLACEEAVESRLISCYGRSTSGATAAWQLRHGPFSEADFLATPEADWTLLVQAVDQWQEAVHQMLEAFDFLPRWRIDDIMISYATPGGGVGPHFDYYDVFLVQGAGRRRWRLGQRCDAQTATVERAGQAILPDFEVTADYELEPGDALYVPAGVAHWGECTTSGLCYSVGLRAPSEAEMIAGVSDLLVDSSDPARRYQDPATSQPPAHSGEIMASATDGLQQTLSERLSDPLWLKQWFGMAVTQPRYPELLEPLEQPVEFPALLALVKEQPLTRHPASRMAFTYLPAADQVLLFVDGECFALPAAELQLARELCQPSLGNLADLLPQVKSPGAQQLLAHLVSSGSLYLGDEER